MKKYIKPNTICIRLYCESIIALSNGVDVNDTVPIDDDEDNCYTKTIINNHSTWDTEW